jgi:glycosyltransferase involved in cell wall biosynthesis
MSDTVVRPFFTVIIATYNAEATLVRCIESVLAQTEAAQIVVVDGLSKDRTVELVRRYAPQGVHVKSEKDRGVYDAWNKGVAMAQGEWIVFLGADDYYDRPTSLAHLRAAIASAPPECCIAYGQVDVVNAHGKTLALENEPWLHCKKRLKCNMPYTHVGSAHHTSLFVHRSFDPQFKIAGDYHFLYPVLVTMLPLFVEGYVVKMKDGGLSTNYSSRLSLLIEIKKIRVHYEIKNSFFERFWTNIKIIAYASVKYVKHLRTVV